MGKHEWINAGVVADQEAGNEDTLYQTCDCGAIRWSRGGAWTQSEGKEDCPAREAQAIKREHGPAGGDMLMANIGGLNAQGVGVSWRWDGPNSHILTIGGDQVIFGTLYEMDQYIKGFIAGLLKERES